MVYIWLLMLSGNIRWRHWSLCPVCLALYGNKLAIVWKWYWTRWTDCWSDFLCSYRLKSVSWQFCPVNFRAGILMQHLEGIITTLTDHSSFPSLITKPSLCCTEEIAKHSWERFSTLLPCLAVRSELAGKSSTPSEPKGGTGRSHTYVFLLPHLVKPHLPLPEMWPISVPIVPYHQKLPRTYWAMYTYTTSQQLGMFSSC